MFFWKRKTEEQSSTSLPLVQGKGDFQQGEHSGNRPWRLEASRQESARPGAGGHMTLYDMRMDGCVLGLPAGPWEHRSNPARTRPVVYPPIPRDLRGGERQVLQLTGKKRHTEEIACPTSPSLGFGGGPGGSGPSGGRTEVTPLEQAAGALLLSRGLWAQDCSNRLIEDGLQASLGECRTFQVLH